MRGRSFPVGHRIFPGPQGGRSRPPHLGDLKWRRLRRRGVRRDEGIPPYGRPEGGGRPCETQILFVGAGFIPPGVFAVPRGVRDDASIVPYMGFRCDKVAVPGWSHTLPLTVGADSISARGRLRRRGARRDEGIPPYGRPGGCSPFRFGGAFRKVCRGGIYPARGLAATQGPRDDLRPKSRACGLWPPKRACGRSGIVPYRGLL